MNTPLDDGGPAFPCNDINEDLTFPRGMSLRDWFAGMALQGFISSYPRGDSAAADLIAPDCYEMANAMLAARKESQ